MLGLKPISTLDSDLQKIFAEAVFLNPCVGKRLAEETNTSTTTYRWSKIDPHAHSYFQGVGLGLLSIQPDVLQLVGNIIRRVRFVVFIPFVSSFVVDTAPGHHLTSLIQKVSNTRNIQ
jgi:hypothetical protein